MRNQLLPGPPKRAALVLLSVFWLAATAAPVLSRGQAQQDVFKLYVMEKDYFSCDIPASWELRRDAEEDAEYGIYEIDLTAPASMTSINVRYLLEDNADFSGYQDFFERNSKNVLGETGNAREQYGPVENVQLGGRDAFRLRRDRMVDLHPESKSDESVRILEILYVVPMKDGSFYVLHYAAEAEAFEELRPVFDRVAASFRARGR